ncbi:MAG: hypothetical protein U5L96_00390 [Owenweeksia sp.]|nr:hypothetical protein [Owenweeksia sp.]
MAAVGDEYPDNAIGTVSIETSIDHEGNNYDVVGEVNATLQSSAGSHKITGHFWSNDAN